MWLKSSCTASTVSHSAHDDSKGAAPVRTRDKDAAMFSGLPAGLLPLGVPASPRGSRHIPGRRVGRALGGGRVGPRGAGPRVASVGAAVLVPPGIPTIVVVAVVALTTPGTPPAAAVVAPAGPAPGRRVG